MPSLPEDALLEAQARVLAMIAAGRSDSDVTELLRKIFARSAELSERQQFLSALDAATQPLVEPTDIMQTTARLLAVHLGADRCAYANVEDERVFDITGDYAQGVPSIVGRWDVAAFGPACVQHMLANTAYVVEDTDLDPRIPPELLAAYRATTIRAVICVPLHKQGVFTAAMAVHQRVPRTWSHAEVELVSLVVARCWEALERAAALRTRLAAERALEESRARLDYAVRLSGIGFWYCDLPFEELIWDVRVKEHFGLPPDTRVTIELFYDRIHPDDREPTRAAIDASISNHTAYDIVYRTVDPRSDEVKYIRALGGAVYALDGTAVRFDGVTVDVTEHVQDRERLARVAHELLEQDRRKDEFLATLSHELRNPLAPIVNGMQLLRATDDLDRTRRTRMMMERQLRHLVRMVDDLLDISRVTLGKVVLVKERVSLRSVIEGAMETTQPSIQARGHDVTVALAGEEHYLEVDPTRIAQVLANLINNAVKYTPPNGRISVSASAGAGWVEVRVSDTGVGIPADKLTSIFDLFTQLGQPIDRAQGGLGIGLTLARRLVELHGGAIAAHSAGPGSGASFTVRLPLASEPSATPTHTRAPETTGLRILIVDDNVDAAELLGMLFEAAGNTTRLAHNGPDALELAALMMPDVVVLDIGLPGLDGYEVARRLRADPALPRPLLVAVTGWGSEEHRRDAQAAGVDAHLVKPIDFAKLAEVIATLARGRG